MCSFKCLDNPFEVNRAVLLEAQIMAACKMFSLFILTFQIDTSVIVCNYFNAMFHVNKMFFNNTSGLI